MAYRIAYLYSEDFLYTVHMVQTAHNLPYHRVETRAEAPARHNAGMNLV